MKFALKSVAVAVFLASSQLAGVAYAQAPTAPAVITIDQASIAAKEAQLASDKAALQRALKRLEADEAKLNADNASGEMAAESKDSMQLYRDQQAIKGLMKDVAADKLGSLQLRLDKAALWRALGRLEADEEKLKLDKASGKMAAESKDSIQVYRDQQVIKGDTNAIAADQRH
jgi:hypothetical protein